MTEIIQGIMAVYQMEQEFYPYLNIEFMPKNDEEGGIILISGNNIIRKYWTFHNKKEIEELRNLIWNYLVQERNIKDITKDGCLVDFRDYNPNTVIQGWKNRKRYGKDHYCCKFIIERLTDSIMETKILHEVYRLSNKDVQTRETCKSNRFGECGDNYPKNTALFNRCVREANWLCNNGYPNKTVNRMNDFVRDVRIKIYDDLKKNNLMVNKKKFDEIIDAGLFADLGNRMGNKVANDKNVSATLDQIFTEKDYYLGLIEGFDEGSDGPHTALNDYPVNTVLDKCFGLFLLILVISFVYILSKNRN